MEIFTNDSREMHFMKVLVRNSMLPLIAFLWLCVLYFFDDENVANLSILTTFVTEHASPEIRRIDATFIYLILLYISFILRVLAICDILLEIFPQFWKTAFYSVCFAVSILKIKYEMVLRTKIRDRKRLYGDTKDNGIEFVRVIPNTTDITLHKVAKDETRLTHNKIKDLNKDGSCIFISQDGKNDSSFWSNSEKLNTVKHERTSETDDQILHENPNHLTETLNNVHVWRSMSYFRPCAIKRQTTNQPLNHASLARYLKENFFEQSNENVLHDKNTETQSDSFIKQDEFSRKYRGKLFESTSECGGTKCPLKMSEPQELALTTFDPSNIKINSKQTEENGVSSEESTILNDKTLKESKFRDDVLKQSNTVSDMIEHINRPSTKVKNERLNALVNTYSHVQKDVSLGKNSNSSNLCRQNLDDLIDQLYEKFSHSYNDDANFLLLNNQCRMHLDIDEQLKNSPKAVNGIQTIANPERILTTKVVSQTRHSYDIDETSDSETKNRVKRQASMKASDFQDETETKNNFKDFLLSESPPESNVLNCVDIDFDDKISGGKDSSNNSEASNGLNELAKKSFENEGETHFLTVNDVEGVVNRIDPSFIYAL